MGRVRGSEHRPGPGGRPDRPGGIRVTDLAEQAGVTKQTAGYLVDQLERAGYVRRVPDPTDARARLVQIADRGLAVREVARATEAIVEAEWAASTLPARHPTVALGGEASWSRSWSGSTATTSTR